MTTTERRWSTSSNRSGSDQTSYKFPDFDTTQHGRGSGGGGNSGGRLSIQEEGSGSQSFGHLNGKTPSPIHFPSSRPNGKLHSERFPGRRNSTSLWGNGHAVGHQSHSSGPSAWQPARHSRQKSLSDALRTIRTRKGSVSANAHEIAEALKAPVSYRLVILCLIWYFSSALTNTSSKSILNAFPQPITLTLIQFAFVAFWCLLFAQLAKTFPAVRQAIPALKNGIRRPSREVIRTTLPLALFQLFGHIFSSTATSKIPVSLVHTIKGLSPLFTVLAYRFIFHIHYSVATYLSLIPLTIGVVLACSVEFSGNIYGILCAFIAALVFVSQNIFSKKLFNEAAKVEADGYTHAQSKKLDKLNLLCYCSALAFLLNLPVWMWTEGFPLIVAVFRIGAIPLSDKPTALDHGRLTLEFIFNGIFHFGQNILAFVLLSMVSPVTYSVASLIKRVFVILAAIIWFGSSTSPVQAAGIALTFLGLYLYDRTSDSSKADRRAKALESRNGRPLLPLSTDSRDRFEPALGSSAIVETPVSVTSGQQFGNGYVVNGEEKKLDAGGPGRSRGSSSRAADHWVPSSSSSLLRQDDAWRGRELGAVT
ncbi:suppressor of loss of ypt1 [Agyrium rufum]|nr:suppressor of loss of ypt1 [Agyrium rufum]